MSRPRLFRTDTVIPLSATMRAKRSTRESDGRSNSIPGAAFNGIRLTLLFTCPSSLTRRFASSGESFTSGSRTYSKVKRSRRRRGRSQLVGWRPGRLGVVLLGVGGVGEQAGQALQLPAGQLVEGGGDRGLGCLAQ